MVYLKKKIIIILAVLPLIIATAFVYKTGHTITVIGSGKSEIWHETISNFKEFPEPEEDRIDILLVGIRGFDADSENRYKGENGEYLADTILLVSFNKENNQASIISIPRDLYVDIPDHGEEKINTAYAVGEARHYGGGGLQLMKALVSQLSGVYVDYAVSIDFEGFKKIIDNIGGITIYRDTPFSEGKQWIRDGREGKRYWRFNAASTSTSAGWEFYVPKGANDMNSEEVLYYARSRYSSSDFDRMRRQQEVISAIKSKALNLGVLANPIKIFNILDTLKDNVRSDMSISEMKEIVSLVQKAKIQNFKKEVLDSGDEGFLIEDRVDGKFVLLPKEGNYDRIKQLFQSIIE